MSPKRGDPMDRRQSSKGKLERGRTPGRGVWVWYLTTGAALAVVRVVVLLWPTSWYLPETAHYYLVHYGLFSQRLLSQYTALRAIPSGGIAYVMFWGSIVTVESFLMATPILLLGWPVRRVRRVLVFYLSAGAALAVARVALLVWIGHRVASHSVTDTVNFVATWLYPEAIMADPLNVGLVNYLPNEYYGFIGWLAVLASFVYATPILLVGWLRRKRESASQRA
jgi:hypothetical protein